MYIIGVDIGRKRVGVAVAETETGCIFVRGIFERAKYLAEKEIINIIKEIRARTVIVGCPLGEHGEETTQAVDAKNFARRLAKRVEIEVILTDEYLTSQDADELRRASTTGSSRAQGNDGIAAALILQAYLRQNPKPC